MNEAFVYMWSDVTTGKKYIGCHKGNPLDGYVCSSKPMMREYKQRPQDFHRLITDFGTWKDMLTREQTLIAEHSAVKDPMFYNQARGIGPYHANWGGKHHTKESNAKNRAAHLGKKLSEEHKAKIAAAQKGIPKSEEARKNLSVARKLLGTNFWLGKHHSEEAKSKIAAAHTGRKYTEEAKARMSASHMGRIVTKETREKISAFRTGRPLSEETRARISKTLLGKIRGPYKKKAK